MKCEKGLAKATATHPEFMCYDSHGQHEMKNTNIPGEGLTSIAYAASKKNVMGLKRLVQAEEKNCLRSTFRLLNESLFCSSQLCGCHRPKQFCIEMNKVGSVQSKSNQGTILKIERLEQTANDLRKDIGEETVTALALQKAQQLWDDLIDSDPFYNKSAFMISCQLKDVPSVRFFMTKLPDVFDLDYNLRDHKKRSGFILACQEIEDLNDDPNHLQMQQESNHKEHGLFQSCSGPWNSFKNWYSGTGYEDNDDQDDQGDENIEPRKKLIKLFLEHAKRLDIDLTCRDDTGRSGFDYLPEDWIEEFRTDYPEHF